MVITFDNVSFEYSERKILDHASFTMTDSDKIGIIGVNGTGKTTILKLITGIEKPLSGTITISGGMIINYLEQEPKFRTGVPILDIVLEGSTKEHKIEEYEAKSMLSKLGLNDYYMVTDHMSGGELKRLALAKALITYCDVLILDEPTNHLDASLIVWLEKYLMKYKHGLLMVTHDRYFLERITNRMLELDFGKTYMYEGNYEAFLTAKEERLQLEEAAKRKLKSILRVETEWIKRGCEARSTKQKARIERYEEMKDIKFNKHEEMEFSSVTTRLGKKLIEINNASKRFSSKTILDNFTFNLQRYDAIGIVGDNGAGKSTFFKIIMGEVPLDSGELIKGETLNIGYLPQHLSLIDPEIRVIDYVKEKSNQILTTEGTLSASEFLESFLFDSSIQYSKVKILSGGEKRRLQIVEVLSRNPNLLILDEPTNDLDLYTLGLLEDYILKFKGPVLVVSHDRYFLDKVANKLLLFKDGKIEESILQYSEYLKSLDETKTYSEREKNPSKDDYKKNRLPSSIKNEYNKLEKEIPLIETKLDELKKALAKETTDYVKMMDLQKEIDTLNEKYETMFERFIELEEIKKEYER